VRDLIDNAQYMPSRGRYKVYLIDEVHMLSKPAFNALLKTLEEPPEHVKFLFATTDPEKLLVTVLSRCLQFNLKRLDEEQIGGQIGRILEAEGIAAEPGAIRQLARAADGSLRDGLSLLDQAIAYSGAGAGGAVLSEEAVAGMLGTVDRSRIDALLQALADGDGSRLMSEIGALAEMSPDWAGVLDALAAALHRIQVRQLVPDAAAADDGLDVDTLASALRPELVQLWYQMALGGRRDLELAPGARAGFEMSLLRMLAFRPAEGGGDGTDQGAAAAGGGAGRSSARDAAAAARAALAGEFQAPAKPARGTATASAAPPEPTPPPASLRAPAPAPAPVAGPASAPAPASPPAHPSRPVPAPAPTAAATGATADVAAPARARSLDAAGWLDLVAGLDRRGPQRALAAPAALARWGGGVLRLAL